MVINNPNIASFFTGNATYPQGGARGNLGGLGSMGASSTSADYNTPTVTIPSASAGGTDLTAVAAASGSVVSNIGNLVRGVLSAEAAQNGIVAQRNLTAALSPGVIVAILGVIGYVLVTRK